MRSLLAPSLLLVAVTAATLGEPSLLTLDLASVLHSEGEKATSRSDDSDIDSKFIGSTAIDGSSINVLKGLQTTLDGIYDNIGS